MVVCAELRRGRTMQSQHGYHGYSPQHRDPPPYPGHFRPLYQPGYRQSYSGSETSTDLSLSSTENLSTFTRQDPQGEETAGGVTTPSLDPWDTQTADPNYGLLPQLGNVPTSGVEIRSTNSATFYVTGNRPTSASPNQEMVHWNGELTAPPGGCYVNNVMPGQSSIITTGTKIMYPSAPAVYATSKMAPPVGARPQSAHGVPSLQRRDELHVVPRPASVNANPLPGICLSENSPPRQNFMPNLTNAQQSKPVAMTTTAAAIVTSSLNHASYPPPPSYPGNTQKTRNQVSASGNARTNANTAITQTVNSNRSPTLSANTSPCATSDPPVANNTSPTATGHSMVDKKVLKPLENKRLREKELRRSFEMIDHTQLTRSHPDLTRLVDTNGPTLLSIPRPSCGSKPPGTRTPSPQPTYMKQATSPRQSSKKRAELDHAAIATHATQMVERLSEENKLLRQELEGYYRKVTKLQKFELEIQKVHDSYESLVKQSQRRESLDKIMRFKLEAEVRKLADTNKELTDQLNKALSQLQQKQVYNLSDSELKKEIGKKDSIIGKLISQNKELSSAKERQEIEVAAQRSTLQEQRTHIDVLDTALSNAQTTILRLEDEVRQKSSQDDTVMELQRTVAGLQMAAEKKDSLHQRLQTKLEEQIRTLQEQEMKSTLSGGKTSDTDEGTAPDSPSGPKLQGVIQQLQNKDQHILLLELDNVKWEERYLEEHALRQLAVDAASMPKDARIAALEQNSAETGKIIAEARTDRLKHLEEVYQANRKVAELEARVKTQQAQLAERDAMILVMQKHSSMSRASSISSLLYSPIHSPRPSLTSPLTPSSSSSSPAPVSAPPSGASSRQSSQLDQTVYRDARPPLHSKSNSTGSSSQTSSSANSPSTKIKDDEAQIKELKKRLAAQAALFQRLQLGPDQLSKCLWQV